MDNLKYLLNLSKIDKRDTILAGGKASSLGELLKIGISVPPGFVITTECYKNFWNQELPVGLKEEILQFFDELKTERVAVRSSAVSEDSLSASWAGQLDTYLNIHRENLIDAIRTCWKSIRTERALSYAGARNIKETELAVGVVIQKMVESKISGVMFTVNPVNKKRNELMIESAFGLGELIVQGEITPDNFLIDKKTLQIIEQNIQSKETMLIFQDGENKKVSVSSREKNKQSVTSDQVKQLTTIGVIIENHYQKPQDIEWSIDSKGKIWILQSRPITSF